MRVLLLILLVLTASACSKGGKSPRTEGPDYSAFFTAQKAWCRSEKGATALDDIEKYVEVFAFDQKGQGRIYGFDLDEQRRLKWNAKGQPLIKELDSSKVRFTARQILFLKDVERYADYKLVDRGPQKCFQLESGGATTTHCPCELPEAK